MLFSKTALRLLLAAGALSHVAMADQPIPSTVTGTWTGNRMQSFALSNASDPSSFECLPGGTISSRPVVLTASTSNNSFAIANMTSQSLTVGAATYLVPAAEAQNYRWAAYDPASHILKLRDTSDNIVCHYATLSGSGADRKITVVTLGGEVYTNDWTLQCQPSSYAGIPSIETVPYCASPAGSRVAANSTVIHTFSYQSGGEVAGNGAGSATLLGSLVAAAGAGAAMLVFG